jgi:hypothetical protein
MASPPAAATQPATADSAPAPPAATDDVNKVLEQAMPLVNGAAQADPVAEQSAPVAAPQAPPAQTEAPAPAAPAQSAWELRKARREERQRRGHEFTLALNLGDAAEQQPTQSVQSPVAATASAPQEPEAEPPLMVMQAAPAAPKSPIPDNPY